MEVRGIGPLIFVEKTINGDDYCDMLAESVFPSLLLLTLVYQEGG